MAKRDWKEVLRYDPTGTIPKGICELEEKAVLHSISRNPDVMENALWTFEGDLTGTDDPDFEAYDKDYKYIKGIQKKLGTHQAIMVNDLNKDSVSALIGVVDYNIPVRKEDFESGDPIQIALSERHIPILYDMKEKLITLRQCYRKL